MILNLTILLSSARRARIASARLDESPIRKRTTTALDSESDQLLSRAARERGVWRSEFIGQHLSPVTDSNLILPPEHVSTTDGSTRPNTPDRYPFVIPREWL